MEALKKDFGIAYATVLTKIFNCWMHDEDGGCDYDAVGRRQVLNFGTILAIFQPKGAGDCWVEEAALIFTLTKEGKAAGHKLNLRTFEPIIETVNKKLFESWTNFIGSRQNKWMEPMETKEFATYQDFVNPLCGITKPLEEGGGVIKFSYTIKYWYMDYHINYWNPLELIQWTGTDDETTYVTEEEEEYVLSRGHTCVIPRILSEERLAGKKRASSENEHEPANKKLRLTV